MVKINKVVTKHGDRGDTGLFGKGRVRKDSIRMEAIGAIDEVIAVIGMLRSLKDLIIIPQGIEILAKIQNDLFDLGSELAASQETKSPCPIVQAHISSLEKACTSFNKKLKKLNSFVLPGGSQLNAWLHIARVATRKAERKVVKFTGEQPINPLLQIYLNRLSDLFFILARCASHHQNIPELLWKPGG